MIRNTLLVRTSTMALAWIAFTTIADAQGVAKKTNASSADRSQTAQSKAPAERPAGENESEIVVTGVRSSLAQARETKRKSDSIVDVVEAEDIGKLPNNTVGDVIASIPGINVYRREGEVDNIQLRGLGGVQTTIGGTPIESGGDRVATIADLPSDLVKSVEVYKTRTPDQVEGGGAGTININFRTPTDFKKGLTFSGNIAGRYNNQARRANKTYTGILNYRFDSAIGDLGAQIGFTLNENPFLESQARNDPLAAVQTRQVVGPQILPLPTFAPEQIFFLYTTGARKTPSWNGALQWSTESDSVVLEGNYAAPQFDRFNNQLFAPVTIQLASTNALPALSNIVLVPGTNRIKSATVSPVNQIGPISGIIQEDSNNYLLKLSVRHSEELFDATAEISTTGGEFHRNALTIRNRFVNRPVYDVDFASDEFRFPMMNLTFRNVDLLDPNQYRFFGVVEDESKGSNRNLFSRADLTLRPPISFIDSLKTGLRFTSRTAERRAWTRTAANLQINLADMPQGYNMIAPIAEGFGGTGVVNNARWLSYDRAAVRENYDALRAFLTPNFPEFATEQAPENQSLNYTSKEKTVAAYGTINYKFDLLFPISGLVGARVTNWFANSTSFRNRTARVTVNGVTSNVTLVLPQAGRGNTVTVEPTVTAILKFTPQFQARLSYNVGIRRPSIDQLTPYINFSDVNLQGTAGNSDLRPEKTTRYDAIFEYYFGRIGMITVNPFYWKLDGTITSFRTNELVEGGGTDLLYAINRPYNAGSGYRRGVEAQAQTFFTFLPGIFKNFGTMLNYTYTESEQTFAAIPGATTGAPATAPVFNVAKHVGNAALLFERGTLNARVSYNYNGTQLDTRFEPIRNSSYIIPRQWVDAAINYTIPDGPLRNIGFSIQVQNALATARRSFYGYPDQPRDVVYMARTYGGTIRYRF